MVITNSGTEALSVTVGSPATSAFSVIAGGGPTTLDAKQSETVTVEFVPAGAGSFGDAISISSDATKGGADATVKLKGKAKGTPPTPIATPTPSPSEIPTLLVSNATGDSVTTYPANGEGNIAPSAFIYGSNAGFDPPLGVTTDASGTIYVTNNFYGPSDASAIQIYGVGANGNVSPTATIAGPDTGLILNSAPTGIALSCDGTIYVAVQDNGNVLAYPPNSNGDIPPSVTIAGLSNPVGVAFDQSGRLYVAEQGPIEGGSVVAVFAGGANGVVPPIATISGSNTRLSGPEGIAVDSSGNVYVTNAYRAVTVFPPLGTSTGNLNEAPIVTIEGSSTGLSAPYGIMVDRNGIIYVANGSGGPEGNGSIAKYAPIASLPSQLNYPNVTPLSVIAGSNTLLGQPEGIAIDAADQPSKCP